MSKTYIDIDKSTIRELSQRSNLWGAWLTFHVWAVITAAGAIFILWPNPLTFILAVIIIGTRQHGMSTLMHDAAHGLLFKSKKLNEFVGFWLLAAPYGGDLFTYRKYHLRHHRHAQSPEDPDLPLSDKYPVTKQSLIRKLLRDITGMTFIRVRIATYKMSKGEQVAMTGTDAFEKSSAWPNLITNLIIFAALSIAGYWWVYFALWLLPLFTVFWAVLRIRNIAEHALTEHSDNPLKHARTTHANFLARILLAPYWVNYHVEHHAYMYVPCYNLPKLHKVLLREGYKDKMDYRPGYLSVLKSAITPA